jgi:hypothetical protein
VLSVCLAKTTQNVTLALLVSRPQQLRRLPLSSHNAPGHAPRAYRGFYGLLQVTAQFTFYEEALGSHRPALVSTHIKKQEARAFLVLSRLPFGSRLKYSRFFQQKRKRQIMLRIFIKFTQIALFPIPPFPVASFIYFRRFQNELL